MSTLQVPSQSQSDSFWASCCTTDPSACLPTHSTPWFRLIVGMFVAAQTMTLGMAVNVTPPDDQTTLLLLQLGMLAATLVVLLLLGWPLAVEAARQLWARRLTMELLFLAGILAAMGISVQSMIAGGGPVYFEVVNILLVVYSVGHAINAHTRRRALSAVQAMTAGIGKARVVAHAEPRAQSSGASPVILSAAKDLASPAADVRAPTRPDASEYLSMTGGESEREQFLDVATVQPGDIVRVFPGELIPVDGVILSGVSLVRQTAFTGEWTSRVLREGDAVLAGTACEDGTLDVRATAPGTRRRVDLLADLIDQARQTPTRLQRQADRFVRWFLPIVAVVGYGTFVHWTMREGWHAGLMNALAVLLIACPCAAGLATPLAVWSVLARLAARGLVLRSGDAVERLAAVDGVIFDKTGTLSDESLVVCDVVTSDDPNERRRILAIIAAVERHSHHPVARAIQAMRLPADGPQVQVLAIRTLPGRGIEADVRIGDAAAVHTARLVRDDADPAPDGVLAIQVTLDEHPAATLHFAERLRGTAASAVEHLRRMGLPVQIMTGDTSAAASHLADTQARMTPEQKHAQVKRGQESFSHPLFVGDGINDAAAMAASHVSIALATGAQVTVETASGTLHGGDLSTIPYAIAMAQSALATVRTNLHWAVAYNAVGIAAAACGYLHPVLASVLMACSSLVVGWRSGREHSASEEGTKARRHGGTEGEDARAKPRRRWAFATAHGIGMVGQGLVLAVLADASLVAAVAMGVAFALLAYLVVRLARHAPMWLDMTLGMINLGGLGMNLGWWIDQGFASAIRDGKVMSCCTGAVGAIQASVHSSSHWMYWGMLILGVPAMYLLRRTPERFSLKRWCCVGPLVLGVPGMCFGMWVGALWAARLGQLAPWFQVIVSYALMMGGMAVGMLVPHSLDLILPGRAASEDPLSSEPVAAHS